MEKETPNAEIAPETAAATPAEGRMPVSGASDAGGDVDARIIALTGERDRLLKENEELNDLLLRRAAEFDNHRKRTERDRSELIEFAASDAVKALLPVIDDFERALKQECADPEYAKGVALIYQRMFDTLNKLGLEPIEAVGHPFDPNYHHAIEMVPTEEAEHHTVLQDLLRGYLFKGRLLRASMVRVASRG